MMSMPVRGFCSLKARNLPSGLHEAANWVFWLSVRRWASPVPSARCQYRFSVVGSARLELNTMRFPSGVQTGLRSWPGLKVRRVDVSRAQSYIQTSGGPPAGATSIASRVQSGENCGLLQFDAMDCSGPAWPFRSIQTMGAKLVSYE